MMEGNNLLVISLLVTVLFVLLSSYLLFLRPRISAAPVIYLVGPSGSGKTALWGYLKHGRVIPTQTSMSINSASIKHASLEKEVTIIDCPGHPRLAHILKQSLSTHSPRGVIILIDAATIKQDVNAVANMVYSTLLALPKPVHVLIVANKSDLFTALPVRNVRELLEGEITSVKRTRDNSVDEDEERIALGGAEFQFEELESDGVLVEWTQGSVESRQVAGILEWISSRTS